MRRMIVAATVALFSALLSGPISAQSNFPTPGGAIVDGKVEMCLNALGQAIPCSAAGAIPNAVSATQSTATTGGATPFHLIAANSDNSQLVGAAGAHTVYGVQLSGLGSAPAYLKFYDKATAPTCGSDAVKKSLMIPAASTAANGAGSNVSLYLGTAFTLGIGICVVTGIADTDDTAVAAATFDVNIDYK